MQGETETGAACGHVASGEQHPSQSTGTVAENSARSCEKRPRHLRSEQQVFPIKGPTGHCRGVRTYSQANQPTQWLAIVQVICSERKPEMWGLMTGTNGEVRNRGQAGQAWCSGATWGCGPLTSMPLRRAERCGSARRDKEIRAAAEHTSARCARDGEGQGDQPTQNESDVRTGDVGAWRGCRLCEAARSGMAAGGRSTHALRRRREDAAGAILGCGCAGPYEALSLNSNVGRESQYAPPRRRVPTEKMMPVMSQTVTMLVPP